MNDTSMQWVYSFGALCQPGDSGVIQPKIEDRVHHPRHRRAGA